MPNTPTPDGRDLLTLIFELLQHDFCEDDDMVQGNWKFDHSDNVFIIEYDPFPDSPFPAKIMRYRVTPIPDDPPNGTPDWRDGTPKWYAVCWR